MAARLLRHGMARLHQPQVVRRHLSICGYLTSALIAINLVAIALVAIR
jgi:hypothetical protein